MAKRPDRIWWCGCGAMIRSVEALDRHLNGKTICQRRQMREYEFTGRTIFPADDPASKGTP